MASPPPSVRVEVLPLFGASSPMGEGWVSVGVRLANGESTEVSGVVELKAAPSWSRDNARLVTSAPFALAPKARVSLELPTHGFSSAPSELELSVTDRAGNSLAKLPVPEFRVTDPLLLDLSAPSRIAPAVRGIGMVARRNVAGGYRAPTALVTSPLVDPATGDPVLPRWAAAYGSATLVVSTGRTLGTLGKRELRALSDWVLAGGALAVVVDRPEDLRLEALVALTGGAIERTEPPGELLEPALFFVATDGGLGTPGAAPTPGTPPRPAMHPERRAPGAVTASLLEGFSGGNLRPSPWGAVASYGLGELHLLAFDTTEAYLRDRWTQLKLVDLLRHAWERQRAITLPLGQTGFDGYRADSIGAALDPNRNVRWTIVAAALLLLVYATLAGPLNFWLASRQGKPLRALVHLPFWAAGALGLVVALGLIGKGVSGHARRLTLVEAGAGMERAAATRFRGLYASSSREITVVPTARTSLLEVSGDDYVERTLVVDRDGARLERLRTKPWATVVVREDGFLSLAGGISIVSDASGHVVIKNRTARDLVAAILKPPGRPAVLFPRIRDGAAVSEAAGNAAAVSASLGVVNPYSTVHPLSAELLEKELDRHVEGLGGAWKAIEAQGGSEVDFWPEDVPVLIAELDGGEGKTRDSGLAVDVDRVLVRVVGWGGVP